MVVLGLLFVNKEMSSTSFSLYDHHSTYTLKNNIRVMDTLHDQSQGQKKKKKIKAKAASFWTLGWGDMLS